MKKVSGGFALWTPGEKQRKGKGKERGERTEEKKVMEKEGLKKGKGNYEARRYEIWKG
jgi:hypothetical protein